MSIFLYYDVRCSQMNTIMIMAWKPWLSVFMPLSFVHERIVFNGFHSTIPAIVHEFNDTHECNARMVSVEWFQCRDSNPDLHAFDMACCHWHHMTFSIGHVSFKFHSPNGETTTHGGRQRGGAEGFIPLTGKQLMVEDYETHEPVVSFP